MIIQKAYIVNPVVEIAKLPDIKIFEPNKDGRKEGRQQKNNSKQEKNNTQPKKNNIKNNMIDIDALLPQSVLSLLRLSVINKKNDKEINFNESTVFKFYNDYKKYHNNKANIDFDI